MSNPPRPDDGLGFSGPFGSTGTVWTNGSNLAPVTGALFPAVGAPITFNGSVTGEVRGNTVLSTSQTMRVIQAVR